MKKLLVGGYTDLHVANLLVFRLNDEGEARVFLYTKDAEENHADNTTTLSIPVTGGGSSGGCSIGTTGGFQGVMLLSGLGFLLLRKK